MIIGKSYKTVRTCTLEFLYPVGTIESTRRCLSYPILSGCKECRPTLRPRPQLQSPQLERRRDKKWWNQLFSYVWKFIWDKDSVLRVAGEGIAKGSGTERRGINLLNHQRNTWKSFFCLNINLHCCAIMWGTRARDRGNIGSTKTEKNWWDWGEFFQDGTECKLDLSEAIGF